jgi:hypothetical protein
MPISRNPVAMVAIAPRERTGRPERILVSIKDQKSGDVGRYAGWGSEEDAQAPEGKPERMGPGMLPFLRLRTSDRWWRVGIGFFWVPAMIVLITVEDWLNLPQSLMWASLGFLFIGFMAYLLFWEKT